MHCLHDAAAATGMKGAFLCCAHSEKIKSDTSSHTHTFASFSYSPLDYLEPPGAVDSTQRGTMQRQCDIYKYELDCFPGSAKVRRLRRLSTRLSFSPPGNGAMTMCIFLRLPFVCGVSAPSPSPFSGVPLRGHACNSSVCNLVSR